MGLHGDGSGGGHGVVAVAEGRQVGEQGRRVRQGERQAAAAGACVAVRERVRSHGGERRECGLGVFSRRAAVVGATG